MKKVKFLLFIFIISSLTVTGQATTWTISETDGNNDEAQINEAIQNAANGDTIYLPAKTYTIANPIQIKTGVNLQGAGTDKTIIYVPNKADFNTDDAPAMIVGVSDNNIEISGIHFKGPGLSPADIHDASQAYYGGHGQHHAAMRFTSCTNIRVHDCSCELLLNDFVRTSRSSYIYVYNNVMDMHGHDGCQLYKTSNIQVYNNYIVVFINCGVRLSECTNATVYQNTLTSYSSSGWNGIQIQGGTTRALISKNLFTDMKDNVCCVGLQTSGKDCTIKDNAVFDAPAGLINNLGSATISNNVVYNTKQDWITLGYGYTGKTDSIAIPKETKIIDGTNTSNLTSNITENITKDYKKNIVENITQIHEKNMTENITQIHEKNMTENITKNYEENNTETTIKPKTTEYFKPVVINYEDCVVRIYKIPENITPLSFEDEITITSSTL